MVSELSRGEHGEQQSRLFPSRSYFGDLHESPSPILLYVQIKSLRLNLEHFGGQLLLVTTPNPISLKCVGTPATAIAMVTTPGMTRCASTT